MAKTRHGNYDSVVATVRHLDLDGDIDKVMNTLRECQELIRREDEIDEIHMEEVRKSAREHYKLNGFP